MPISYKKFLLLCIAILALTACKLFTVDPPGVGEKAEHGYATLEPLIKTLEQYQADTSAYPESLEELVPDYISSIPTEVNDQPIYYKKVDESFILSFHYIGPGMNTCSYTPEDQWQCSGAY